MKIQIWSDFVCPFCYIGKRRLEKALTHFPEDGTILLEYKSYELAADASKYTGKNMHEVLAEKYNMSLAQAQEMNANVGKQAAEEGLAYQFDTMKPTNTFDAHRLAKYAASKGKGAEMTERLLKAYFTDSLLISDATVLGELAEEIGLQAKEAIALLQSNDFASHVRADEQHARQIGVQGVPFFVFNDKYAVSGAQPVETFIQVIDKVRKEEQEKPILQSFTSDAAETGYCTGDSCGVNKKQ